jgi:hypothetical protein
MNSLCGLGSNLSIETCLYVSARAFPLMAEGTAPEQNTVASEQQPFKKPYEHTASLLI